MSTERGRRTHGAEAFGNPSLQAHRNMRRSRSPAGRARQRWNPDAQLGMWYKEQLLAKLVELNHPDINMLKKSRVPRLRKALEDMGFDPTHEATATTCAAATATTVTETATTTIPSNMVPVDVESRVERCLTRFMPEMVQSVISVLDQRQAQQAGSNSHQEPQTGIRTTVEEQPSSSLTGSGTELHPLLNTMPNLTPSLTTSTWSSDSIGERARGGGITSLNGLGQGPPMASSRGLGTHSSEANAISVDNGSGQGPPMASSHGVGNLNFNVENVCSNVVGQGLPMASSHGPGNIYSEQVGVNSLGQGTVCGVNYGSSSITLSNPGSNANGVGHGLAAYTTTRPGGA